jgi:hypothetical protein
MGRKIEVFLPRFIRRVVATIRAYLAWTRQVAIATSAIQPIMSMELEYATFTEILHLVSQQPAIPPEWWGPIALNLQVRVGRGKTELEETVRDIGRRFSHGAS